MFATLKQQIEHCTSCVLSPILSVLHVNTCFTSSCNCDNPMRYSLLLYPSYTWTEAQMLNNMLVNLELGFESFLIFLALGSMFFFYHISSSENWQIQGTLYNAHLDLSAVFDLCLLDKSPFLGFHDLNFPGIHSTFLATLQSPLLDLSSLSPEHCWSSKLFSSSLPF